MGEKSVGINEERQAKQRPTRNSDVDRLLIFQRGA
ncbi:hypothetical protein N185_09320 [Sinorhizobium sp. GW3]|nr:hypothetical protein N185_09320 [Sinorhizobium sp. GW3]